jgi:hypothetical protein
MNLPSGGDLPKEFRDYGPCGSRRNGRREGQALRAARPVADLSWEGVDRPDQPDQRPGCGAIDRGTAGRSVGQFRFRMRGHPGVDRRARVIPSAG